MFKLGGFVHANVGVKFRILSMTATQLTVYPTPVAMTAQSTFTISVTGKKLLCGTTQRSFSIEQHYPEIDVSEMFLGCRIGDMAISLPPTGMATASSPGARISTSAALVTSATHAR